MTIGPHDVIVACAFYAAACEAVRRAAPFKWRETSWAESVGPGIPFLERVFSKPLLEWVSHRYAVRIDAGVMGGSSLNPELILMIFHSALGVHLTPFAVHEEVRSKVPAMIDHLCFARLKTDRFIQDLLRYKIAELPYSEEAFFEVLAKKVGSMHLEVGDCLIHKPEAPSDRGKVYRVAHKVIKGACAAYFLVPHEEDVAPILLFRPTTTKTFNEGYLTLADDMHTHIGLDGYKAVEEEVSRYLAESRRQWTLAGFSLGGAYAARFLAGYTQHFSKGYFFNDPFTGEKENTDFLAFMETHPEHRVTLHVCHVEGDIVPLAGPVHVSYHADDKEIPNLKVYFYLIKGIGRPLEIDLATFKGIRDALGHVMDFRRSHRALVAARGIPDHPEASGHTRTTPTRNLLRASGRRPVEQQVENLRQKMQLLRRFIRNIIYFIAFCIRQVLFRVRQAHRLAAPIFS